MKKVSLFLAVAGLTTMFAFGQKKETRPVSGFSGIDASNAFNITVSKGSTESLIVEADDEVMPLVRSEVRNGVLHLYLDNANSVRNIRTLKASVVMKNLDKLSLSGACKFTANDLFTPDSFKGDCSGASSMTFIVNTGELRIEASGSSKIQMKANVTGDARLDVSGASKIEGELKANNVKFNSSGVGSVDLSGSATDIKIDVSGTSRLKAGDFKVKTATIESSGSSKITLNVADALKVNSSGASSVEYKGSPTIDAKTGGASKVRKM
jgi:cytoskeletal protein CcmA (bactofilin family)